MKRTIAVLTMSAVSLCVDLASAQAQSTAQPPAPVAGRAPPRVTVMEAVVLGWSVRRDLTGKTVVNDKNEKIGQIDDRDVAIPMEQLKLQNKQLVLPGDEGCAQGHAAVCVPEEVKRTAPSVAISRARSAG